jgi:hypothetical protein
MDQKILKELQDIKKALANVVTKDEAKNIVTVDYLDSTLEKLRVDIAKDTGGVIQDFIVSVDEKKATKEDISDLDKRVTKIERKFAT